MRTSYLASIAVVVSLVACGNPTPPGSDPDAAVLPDSPDAFVATDPDAGPRQYGPCATTADCPDGLICNAYYPGGVCVQPCVGNGDCTSGGVCWGNGCSPTCVLGANDCAPFGMCYDNDTGPDYCIAACYAPDRMIDGWRVCGNGTSCNPWGAYCGPTPSGADNGAPCQGYQDCHSQICFTTPGWIDGACASYARQVPLTEYVPGGPLPQGNCPDSSRMPPPIWLTRMTMEGDYAVCFQHCTADSDCRPGYECMGLQDEGDGLVFSDGVCTPTDDCQNPAHACPAGHTCSGGYCN